MPQMSPLLWTITTISTISLLLITSSFLYFMSNPPPLFLSPPSSMLPKKLPWFNWLW